MLAESDDVRMQGQVGFVGISCSRNCFTKRITHDLQYHICDLKPKWVTIF